MLNKDGYTAAYRFGLGVDPELIDVYNRQPEVWLRRQINQFNQTSFQFKQQKSSSDLIIEYGSAKSMMRKSKNKADKNALMQEGRNQFEADIKERINHAITTESPFIERLVGFWRNHFSISVDKRTVTPLAGVFENETIRKHMMGNFSDLLTSVVKHPAMLFYLDNERSYGPNSIIGKRNNIGLNENLAREILELHTLGVDGGYTQQDVIALAKIITGWTVDFNLQSGEGSGNFMFRKRTHEPGSHRLLGKSFRQEGVEQGEEALKFISKHPSTADFIATKLVRHFVSDNPPKSAVNKIAMAFKSGNGYLPYIYSALIDLSEAWDAPANKVKSPADYIISAGRLCKPTQSNADILYGGLRNFGQIPFTASSPAGFDDTTQSLTGPDMLVRRIEWANRASRRLHLKAPAHDLLDLALGEMASKKTREAFAQTQKTKQATAILLSSPMFQRR